MAELKDTTGKLPSTCECGRRVRVLWSGPAGVGSRPVLLTCGWYPELRCTMRIPVPANAITTLEDGRQAGAEVHIEEAAE